RAVDANPAMLARARRGRYRAWSLRETPEDVRRRYFRAAGTDLVLDESVRGAVSFEHRNLVTDDPDLWAAHSYDVVFCRNVIMYFGTAVQRAVVERVARALVPGGYLFLGHAESLRTLSQRFELYHSHGAFYYRCRGEADGPALARASSRDPGAALGDPAVARPRLIDGGEDWVGAIRGAAERIAALAAGSPAPPAAARARGGELDGVVELMQRERFGDALAALEQLPPVAAGTPDAVLLHAALLAHDGQRAAAGAACDQLLAAEHSGPAAPPLAAGAHCVLALCCEADGDRRGADEHRQTAAHLDPTFAMPRLHLGLAARRLGDHAAARRELGQAVVLLERESASRLLLFGGGFDRDALIALCRAELAACGAAR
ncbi:MAG TPA: CheR family methyltransferase, partial [Kofleriaceae bacterium]|nr:CheR family methyltransferase [Kofleriaceae bacterium]